TNFARARRRGDRIAEHLAAIALLRSNRSLAGSKSRSAAVPAVLRLCYPFGRIRRRGRQCTTVPTAGLVYCTEQSLATGEKRWQSRLSGSGRFRLPSCIP